MSRSTDSLSKALPPTVPTAAKDSPLFQPPRFIFNPTYNVLDPLTDTQRWSRRWDSTPHTSTTEVRRSSFSLLSSQPHSEQLKRSGKSLSPKLPRNKDNTPVELVIQPSSPPVPHPIGTNPRPSWSSTASSCDNSPRTILTGILRKSRGSLSIPIAKTRKKTLPITKSVSNRMRDRKSSDIPIPMTGTTTNPAVIPKQSFRGEISTSANSSVESVPDFGHRSDLSTSCEFSDFTFLNNPPRITRALSCPDLRKCQPYCDPSIVNFKASLPASRAFQALESGALAANLRPPSSSLPSLSPSSKMDATSSSGDFDYTHPGFLDKQREREKLHRLHRKERKRKLQRQREKELMQQEKESSTTPDLTLLTFFSPK